MTLSAQQRAERSARVMWAGDAASRAMGMEIVEVSPGRAVVTMTVRADMVNGWDVGHGALVSAVADSAFAVACNSYGEVTVAAGFSVDFLDPARLGDRLVATAVERWRRGRAGLYDVTVRRAADAGTVAEFRGRSRSLGRPIERVEDAATGVTGPG